LRINFVGYVRNTEVNLVHIFKDLPAKKKSKQTYFDLIAKSIKYNARLGWVKIQRILSYINTSNGAKKK